MCWIFLQNKTNLYAWSALFQILIAGGTSANSSTETITSFMIQKTYRCYSHQLKKGKNANWKKLGPCQAENFNFKLTGKCYSLKGTGSPFIKTFIALALVRVSLSKQSRWLMVWHLLLHFPSSSTLKRCILHFLVKTTVVYFLDYSFLLFF